MLFEATHGGHLDAEFIQRKFQLLTSSLAEAAAAKTDQAPNLLTADSVNQNNKRIAEESTNDQSRSANKKLSKEQSAS
jgi:hypothetical protein